MEHFIGILYHFTWVNDVVLCQMSIYFSHIMVRKWADVIWIEKLSIDRYVTFTWTHYSDSDLNILVVYIVVNFIVFGLTPTGLEPTIYDTQGRTRYPLHRRWGWHENISYGLIRHIFTYHDLFFLTMQIVTTISAHDPATKPSITGNRSVINFY